MKTKKEKLYQGNIPIYYNEYDKQHILESYHLRWQQPTHKNFIFKDTFKFEGFSRGRSSATAEFTNEAKNLSSSMFLSNVSDVILLGGCDLTNLSGFFMMCKKGANYGLKYLGDTLPKDCGLDFVENHIEYISNLVEGKTNEN